jgi:beta-glucosidase
MKEDRLISDFEDKMSAVIQCYLPGNEGGRALVDIIYGDANPSELPYNYPRYLIPLKNIENTRKV